MDLLELTETQRLLRANLQALRAERKWNQENLAEKAGFSEGYIKQLETGKVWVGIDTITRLAQALNVPEGRLFADPATASAEERQRAELEETRKDLLALVLRADQAKVAQLATFLKAELARLRLERSGGQGDKR